MASQMNPQPSFWMTVTEDFASVDSECPNLIREGFSQLLNLAHQGFLVYTQILNTVHCSSFMSASNGGYSLLQGSNGYEKITKLFSLCDDIADESEFQHMMLWLQNSFAYLAMMASAFIKAVTF